MAIPRKKKKTSTDSPCLMDIRIELAGSQPRVWRRIRIDGRSSFAALHHVIQAAMRASGEVTVEVIITGRTGPRGPAGVNGGLIASKKFKLNGVAKRASDVIGAITAVLFTTDDMDLVRGAPSGRRRYLDVMLSQADRSYLRALQGYTKVVTQRNALLKRVQEGAARTDELTYWDEELARDGAPDSPQVAW